jgi:hypothetical protein
VDSNESARIEFRHDPVGCAADQVRLGANVQREVIALRLDPIDIR